jgi:hypothetical protein
VRFQIACFDDSRHASKPTYGFVSAQRKRADGRAQRRERTFTTVARGHGRSRIGA